MTIAPQDLTQEHRGLPPGPRRPRWVLAMQFLRGRHISVPRWHEAYGDTFILRMPPRIGNVVFVAASEDIKKIFAGDPALFHAGEGNVVLKPIMGEHSVLLIDDDLHVRARKLLMPAFNGASLRSYRDLVESISRREVATWHDGETIVTLDRMNALTLEIILQVVFGVTDSERLDQMRPRVTKTVNFASWMLIGFAAPRLANKGPWKRYFENKAELDALLYREIAERRTVTDLADRNDVLSRLLQVGVSTGSTDGRDDEPLTDAELRDQLVTLLLAGHETTASALTWTLHELAMHPDIQREAIAAADSGDDAFLEACLKEGMRVHPIIDQVARKLKSDQIIGGYLVPAGTTAAPSIRLSHAREENFDEARTYRPRRFLDGEVEPHTWIPFGGGVRRCIGAGFSLMEGSVILREILTHYTVSADGPSPTKQRNITSVPADKAPIRLSRRLG
ncbi:MAG: cytochrome [Nocardioidaceae bacterium]|nr:cytochrome [Nocardioidaceae bacterium]